jgi:hypothetical protein
VVKGSDCAKASAASCVRRERNRLIERRMAELTSRTMCCLELCRQRAKALCGVLDRPAHPRILHLLRPLPFLIRHRAACSRGEGELLVGEIERHARIVAPPGGPRPLSTGGRSGLYALRAAFGRLFFLNSGRLTRSRRKFRDDACRVSPQSRASSAADRGPAACTPRSGEVYASPIPRTAETAPPS